MMVDRSQRMRRFVADQSGKPMNLDLTEDFELFLVKLVKLGIRRSSPILMLIELAREGQVKMTGLSLAGMVSTAAATGAVDLLDAAGLIERRSSDDRRVCSVILSQKGRDLMRAHLSKRKEAA